MAKFTPSTVTSGYYSTTKLNANWTALAALLELVVFRDGTSPNTMLADFDMNSNRILNLPLPVATTEPVRVVDLAGLLAGTPSAITVSFTPYSHLASTDVQNAIQEILDDYASIVAGSGASLIGNEPAGNISSTTVQAAINELDAEKVAVVDLASTTDVTKGTALVGQSIQVIGSYTTLRTLAPSTTRNIRIVSGSGGIDGNFYAVTGAVAGTYVDNGGTIIVPTGGNGSAAWLRDYTGAINVRWFGAKGDGVTDDTAAINSAQSAVVAAGGGGLCYPSGDYKVANLVMASAVKHYGVNRPESNHASIPGSRIFSSTGNVFSNSTSLIDGASFENLWIESSAGGGNIFDWSASGIVAKIEISHCVLQQNNATKNVVNGTSSGGVFSIYMHDFEYVYVAACSVPPIYIYSPTVNSIVIENFWSTSNGQSALGSASIHVESANAAGAAINVAVKKGVFELPGSGSVHLLSCANSIIEDCSTYDLTITPGAPQFKVAKGTIGPASTTCAVRRCRSTIGTASFPDLVLDMSVAGQGSFVVEGSYLLYVDGISASTGPYITVINSDITNAANWAVIEIGKSTSSQINFGTTSATSKTYQLWNGYSGNNDGYFNIHQNNAWVGGISPTGYFYWGGTATAPNIYISPLGDVYSKGHIYPGTPAGADQANAGLFGGLGAPNNANGNNGDFYFRSDGGAGTAIYQKRSGAWVGIV